MGHNNSDWEKLSLKDKERLRKLVDGSYDITNMTGGDKDRLLNEGKKRGILGSLSSLFNSNKKNIDKNK